MVEAELRVGVFQADQKISELQLKTKLTSVSIFLSFFFLLTNRIIKSLNSVNIGNRAKIPIQGTQ